jgi:hypothetical protein
MNRIVESGLVSPSRRIYARLALFCCSSGVVLPCTQQRSSHHEQIGQRTGDEPPVGVLGDAAVAHLDEAEEALDHQKRTLALGAHLRFVSILRPLQSAQRRVAAVARKWGSLFSMLAANVRSPSQDSFSETDVPSVVFVTTVNAS